MKVGFTSLEPTKQSKMLHSTGVSEFIEYPTLYEISATAPGKLIDGDIRLFMGDMILIERLEGALLSSYTNALENLEKK